VPAFAFADQNATYHGSMSASETAFAKAIASDLMARYPTAADAEKAGYVRYTSEDDTGAISYANQQWQSADIRHPSQLWYDKNGNLLGADYSVLVGGSPSRPQLWGINPGRWVEFDGHIHWVTKDPASGQMTYDGWTPDKTFTAAGGSVDHPNASTLVAMKKVASADQVVTIFHFPSIWDLIVWVKPNPKGAFADKNPNVQP
jgi:flagellar basal body rod protein FlgC